MVALWCTTSSQIPDSCHVAKIATRAKRMVVLGAGLASATASTMLWTRASPVRCVSPAYDEVWLNPGAMSFRESLAESIQKSDVVVCMPHLASEDELAGLLADGVAACDNQRQWSADGKNRFCVADPVAFSQDTVFRCEELLLRVLDRIDEQLPSVYETLFRPSEEWIARQPVMADGARPSVSPPEHLADSCESLRDLYAAGELEWSEGEPAINVYTTQGGFGTHKDHMALTVLIPLTTGFEGGGTGFWSAQDGMSAGDGEELPTGPPSKVIRPPLGTALVFGGDLAHAGMPVESGMRSVFVCSFSTRTDASREDRVAGLQGGSGVSALRERNEAARERIDQQVAAPVSPMQPLPALMEPVMATAADAPPASSPPKAKGGRRKKGSAKERMRQLDELLEIGMISPEEHVQKRAEVLANI